MTYTPHPDTSPEGEASALSAVYKLVLERHAEKKAAGISGGEDHARKESRHVSRKDIIPGNS